MIIYKCDICKKRVKKAESIVLYKTKLDYCENCSTVANQIRKALSNSIKYYNEEAHKQIVEAEENILKKWR